jgi:hypothetical protein
MSAAPADSSKEATASASATPATAAASPAKQAPPAGSNGDKAAGEKAGESKDQEGKEKEKEAAVPKPPHPLDGLSQAELRKKLEASKKDLRGYLERKKKVDQDLVSALLLCNAVALHQTRCSARTKRVLTRRPAPLADWPGGVHLRVRGLVPL